MIPLSPCSDTVRVVPRRGRGAFTLLEVLLALTIFFMVAFAILELTTQSLAMARAIQIKEPNAGLVATMVLQAEELTEGAESGTFDDLVPGLYPDWEWSTDTLEVGSNGLWRVDITVHRDARGKGPATVTMPILIYDPLSPPGSATGGGL